MCRTLLNNEIIALERTNKYIPYYKTQYSEQCTILSILNYFIAKLSAQFDIYSNSCYHYNDLQHGRGRFTNDLHPALQSFGTRH